MMGVFTSFNIVFTLLCVTAHIVKASEIHFNGSPRTITAGLTDKATLLCSLNDTSSSPSPLIIGRRDIHTETNDVSTNTADVTRNHRDVTKTVDNVAEVVSIIVTRNGLEVATVSPAHPAKVSDSSANLVVSGDVTNSPNGRGFLELTWTYPGQDQTGIYQCSVKTLTSGGQTVNFTSSLSLVTSTPSVGDLINHIRKLEDDSKQTFGRISQLESNFTQSDIVNHIRKLEDDSKQNVGRIAQLERDATQSESARQAALKRISQLETDVSQSETARQAAQAMISQLETHVIQLEANVSQSESARQAAVTRIAQLETEMSQRKSERQEAVGRISQLEQDANQSETASKSAEKRISQLEANVTELGANISQSESARHSLSRRIFHLEADNMSGKHRITLLETTVSHLDHFESGIIKLDMGKRYSLINGTGDREIEIRENFKTAYDIPPQVALGQSRMQASNDYPIRYNSLVIKVDTKGFNVKFATNGNTQIFQWAINWVSIPA